MASSFDEQLCAHAGPAAPTLPLTHLTDYAIMLSVVRSGRFDPPRDCPVYGERLLYTFYGRAAFRPRDPGVNYSDVIYAPVCFLLRPDRASDARRMMPFDSGGYDRYLPAMHPSWTKEEFELQVGPDRLARVANFFWRDDTEYFAVKPLGSVTITPTADKLAQYHRLITSQLAEPFDARCSTVEVQFTAPMNLDSDVEAVIVPSSGVDSDLVNMLAPLGADVSTYDFDEQPFIPSDYFKPLQWAVRDYLRSKGRIA